MSMIDLNINKTYLLQDSPTFCMAPWIHLHIMPDASVIPCCVAPYDDHFGNAQQETLEEIWSSPKYCELRLKMLKGEKCATCQQCYELENSQILSKRLGINRRFAQFFPIVEETQQNGSLHKLDIKYFDVRFSNICNFKCRGCSPYLSSSWYEDYEKLYGIKLDKKKLINCTANGTNDLWQKLATLIPSIKEAYFAGGEPLMMEEHYKTLQVLLAHGRHDTVLAYNTNMSVLRYKNYDLIELWKQFRTVRVHISIDDLGSRGEYYRKGLNWNKLIKNLDTIKKKVPHVYFDITSTINITNVYYLPELYLFFLQNGYINANGILLNMLLTPEEYSIQVLPVQFKQKVHKKLKNSLTNLSTLMPNQDFDYYHQQILGVIDFMNKKDQSHLLHQFTQRTLELDTIREESFMSTYPELRSLLFNNYPLKGYSYG